MKIVAVMPIKLNNERLPGKNTRYLGGRPLLQHELDNLIATEIFEKIYVYCSDIFIKDFLPQGVVFLRRPSFLDEPDSNFTQIFENFINEIRADIYVYAHATAPFVSPETIKQCVDAVRNGNYDSAFCASKIQDYLWKDGMPLNFDAENIPRSQDLKPVFRETSGIYVIPRKTFEQYHRRVGKKPFIKEVDYREAVDINGPDDFRLAEILLGNRFD